MTELLSGQPDLASDAPVRVLHILTSRFIGGPQRQVLRQAERLDPARFALQVVTFLRPDEGHALVAEATARGVPITGLPAGGPFDFRPVAPLGRLLREQHIDLVCTHDAKSTLLGGWAARRAGVPVLGWARGWTGETLRVRGYDALHRRMLRRVDQVVAVSQAVREDLIRRGVRPERIAVIRNAFSSPPSPAPDGRLRQALGAPADLPVLLSVGRLSPEKGHRYLLAAAAELKQRGYQFALALAGDGRERPRLGRQIAARGLGEVAHLLGFRTDVAELLAETDLLVLPSLTEGLPNVVLEAYAAGVPVVASAVGGVPEVVEDGVTGLLVPARDPQALAGQLARLLDNPAAARAMGEAGRATLARFSTAEQLEQVAALYLRLVGRGAEAGVRPVRVTR